MRAVPGRMERIDGGQLFTVIVDYAHTPDALENLLITVRGLPHGKVVTVFGCGGDRDRKKRPAMGEIAARMSDFVIATSDNPRTEDPKAILGEIELGLRKGPAGYATIPDRGEAIRSAFLMARKGDFVIIAGKGHEDYQIVGTRALPFDDRTVALDLIRELVKNQGAQN
jgi:UDP-N-acetylmuramoyl-L-alanyl-D-glutamate--2,6-diaminopimelate ligase